MARVSLPFWNQGQPFEPVIWPEDDATHDDAVAAEFAKVRRAKVRWEVASAAARQLPPNASVSERAVVLKEQADAAEAFDAADRLAGQAIVRLKADFIAKVLGQSGGGDANVRLTRSQIEQAFHVLTRRGHSWEEDAAPLGRGGAASALSPSPASAATG